MRPIRLTPAARAALATLLWGMGLGLLILGVGGRVAMRLVAELTTGVGGFSIGGSFTVVALGLASGGLGAAILLVARRLLRSWPPAPTLLYWSLLLALTLRGLRPLDQLRLGLFLPLVALFGILLQWRTWRYRRPPPADPIAGLP
jgi:hypothetical protein